MIPKDIIEDYELKSYKNEWLRGEIDLPNRLFLHFFKETKDFILNITIQNFDNKKAINKILSIAELEIDKNKIDKKKLNKRPMSGVESFDSLIFAPFDYTLIPSSDNISFDKKLLYFYPIYDFELTGDESKKDIKAITRRVLSTTEWNREPAPLIRYKFINLKHDYGTIGKSFVIDKEENIYSALSNFESNDCLMKVQNILKQKLSITYIKEKKTFKIKGENDLELNLSEILDYLKKFFRR